MKARTKSQNIYNILNKILDYLIVIIPMASYLFIIGLSCRTIYAIDNGSIC